VLGKRKQSSLQLTQHHLGEMATLADELLNIMSMEMATTANITPQSPNVVLSPERPAKVQCSSPPQLSPILGLPLEIRTPNSTDLLAFPLNEERMQHPDLEVIPAVLPLEPTIKVDDLELMNLLEGM